MPNGKSLFCLLVIILGLWTLGCERQAAAPVSIEEITPEDAPDQESWWTLLSISEDGLPRVDIVAPFLAEYEQADSTYMHLKMMSEDSTAQRVVIYLYDATGDSSATVTANEVFYFREDGRFEARGNVVVVTQDESRLESELLLWFEQERKVRTPGFVRIITPKERIQGYNLVADEDLSTYEIQRVTGQVVVEEGA